jgi:putative endopeptidase
MVNMRIGTVVLSVAIISAAAFGQGTSQKGIEVGDLNKSVDPCNDFYEYSNGKWRAENPIPPSMVRWGRRWQAGEMTKEQLKDILDNVSATTDWPKGSVEQLIGDHYASCMNAAQVNQLGTQPIKPLMAEIDAIKNSKDVQRMILRFHELAIPVPFALNSASDNHNPTHVLADIGASGLGLPRS